MPGSAGWKDIKIIRATQFTAQFWPIKGRFAISRESRTEAVVVIYHITETIGGEIFCGRGECVPYRHYGESVDSVLAQMQSVDGAIQKGADMIDLAGLLPAGAARNAIDCAMWDLSAKITGMRVTAQINPKPPQPLETAFTISIDTPDNMAASCKAVAYRPILKVKVGGQNDAARIRAVALAAPASRIILDANEGWRADNITENLEAAAKAGIALIEQPLPAGEDAILKNLPHYVPICADESAHTSEDLDALVGLYDVINIKLDKTGGLTEALRMREEAQSLGFGIMVGCMVATSLSMAPAVLLAQGTDFVDLDGPLLLESDRDNGLRYDDALVYPPESALWG